jgi:hypothetical protein
MYEGAYLAIFSEKLIAGCTNTLHITNVNSKQGAQDACLFILIISINTDVCLLMFASTRVDELFVGYPKLDILSGI